MNPQMYTVRFLLKSPSDERIIEEMIEKAEKLGVEWVDADGRDLSLEEQAARQMD